MLFDVQLQRAFQLAYFIHGDRQIALDIAMEATNRLKTSFSTQYKRLYYRPKGDSETAAEQHRHRYKVFLSDPVLLQYLVYAASEPYEKRQEEQAAGVDEADLVIRFIKHLIMITMARNSFHTAIGVSRLLYNYSTLEAATIYQQLLPPQRLSKDDSYWRVRKGKLMQELKGRFGDRLQVRHGPSGEERFLMRHDSAQWAGRVEQCLKIFTPWGTSCPLSGSSSPDLTPIKQTLSQVFNTENPDEEHLAEEARMHVFVHPGCFAGLVKALGIDPPLARLEVPLFLSSEGGNAGNGFERPPVELAKEEIRAIKQQLDNQAALRKNVQPDALRILINGAEQTCWTAGQPYAPSFEITEDARELEIRTRQAAGDLLLAHHLFSFDESEQPVETGLARVLEGGQKLSLRLTPRPRRGEFTVWQVMVGYQEAGWMLRLARSLRDLPAARFIFQRPSFGAPRYLLAALLLALSGAFAWMFWPSRHSIPAIATNQGPASAVPGKSTTPNQTSQEDSLPARGDAPSVPATTPFARHERTRGIGQPSVTSNASKPQKIFLQAFGNQPVDAMLENRLRSRLPMLGQLTIVPREEAEAALKLRNNPDGSITLWLVMPDGSVLWPRFNSERGRTYRGEPEEMAARIAADLQTWLRRG